MSKVDGSSSVMTMQGTQLRDALANHPAAQLAVIGEMENLSERPEDIQSRQICTDVMNYLETKIASIESQLHVGKISADQRGADDAYLDWHNRAVHALSMVRLRYDRVRKQRHLLFLAEQDRNHQAHIERVAFADKTKAEARARNAEIQLATVKIAAERNVHKQVCRLVEQRFGKHVREELFEAAHQIVTHMKIAGGVMTGPLYRFEMHRTSDGTFTGKITDHYGWVIALRAAPEQTSDGKKHLVGHGWIEERAETVDG